MHITGDFTEGYAEILTPKALAFLRELHIRFNPRRLSLLKARDQRQIRIDNGELPDFLRETCHKRNAPAIGGMAAFIPIKSDAAANEAAMEKVRQDKLRKVTIGQRDMIEAGAAGVHFEDQLSSAKKCGHLGGKVLVPTQEAIGKLVAARLAADAMGVSTLIIARTDAEAANLITSDIDDRDQAFLTGERTNEGFYYTQNGLEAWQYFDFVQNTVQQGQSSTVAMADSTETAQFH